MFNLRVDLTSKLHQISTNSKLRFILAKIIRAEDIIKAQNGSMSEFICSEFRNYVELILK